MLTTGEIAITQSLTITGPGPAVISVSGNNASRIFNIAAAPLAPETIVITGLTLTRGRSIVIGDAAASAGGAIRSIGETLTLDNVQVTDNTAGGHGAGITFSAFTTFGGGIDTPASLTIRNSTISGSNFVAPLLSGIIRFGGGLYSQSAESVTLDNVTVSTNFAENGGGGLFVNNMPSTSPLTIRRSVIHNNGTNDSLLFTGHGGGLRIDSVASATIEDTTFSGNTAGSGAGGGMSALSSGLTLRRSTFSGNNASPFQGGGIFVDQSTFLVQNSTFQGNNGAIITGGGMQISNSIGTIESSTFSDNSAVFGAGVSVGGASSNVVIRNSILWNFSDPLGEVQGTPATLSIGHTLIRTDTPAQYTNLGGNIIGQDPLLGSLQNNGGPTQTMLPAANSPVINAGDPAFAPPPSTDQRGFPRVVGGRIDMGAVELNPGTIQFANASESFNEDAGTVNITVTLVGGSDGTLSAQVAATGGTAVSPADYTLSGTTLNWAANDAAPKTFALNIVDDPAFEPSETIILQLQNVPAIALGSPSTETVTILNNDPLADLSITKTLVPGPLVRGDRANFTITVTNNGPDVATNVVVTDVLPSSLSFISATPSQGTCSGTTTITCSLGSIANGGTATIALAVQMNSDGNVTNTASVSSPNDITSGNNSSSATFAVTLPATVPALSTTMLMLLAGLLGAAAWWVLSKR